MNRTDQIPDVAAQTAGSVLQSLCHEASASSGWWTAHGVDLIDLIKNPQSAWDAAASLLDPLPAGMPTRHDVMAQGFAVVATYLTYSPDAARHYVQSRCI